MKQVATHFGIASSIALGFLVTLNPTTAQIVPDNTLPVNSSVTQTGTVLTIDGGTIRGTNLFHSFQSFSVPTGGEAFFNNGLQIQNILTRVTGNSISNIDGLIRANGTANLFLLNPNGISFGARARLNLGGSFVASTASSLVFADGTVFSTKPDTSTPPLLTISVPLGLQYGSNPASVRVQGSRLQVNSGKTLALVGGNVSLEGGQLLAPGGRVELGGLAGEGIVGLVTNDSYLNLSFPAGVPRGDVALSNGAVVDVRVSADAGGSIGVNAFNLTMTQGSQLLAGIAQDSNSVDAVAGNIEINATGVIDLTDKSKIFNSVASRAQGQGGDINITTSQLRVSGGAQVTAGTFGEGNGRNLTINASKGVQVIGTSADGQRSGLFASSNGASGKAGDLTITTDTMLVRDGAVVNTGTFGEGDGGNLTVNASKGVQVIGTSADGRYTSVLSAQANSGASGQAGNLTITTDTMLVRDGSQVTAGTLGEGDGGNLTVNAAQGVQVIGTSTNGIVSALSAQANSGASGKAGNLTINTGSLLVRDGAQVKAGTLGEGDGGNLTVNAAQGVQVIGTSADGQIVSGMYASTEKGASGQAGNLTITTDTMLVRDGALVTAGTKGSGNGGNLTVNAAQGVQVIGTSTNGIVSALSAQANSGASGQAGNLTINTGSLLVRDGAQVKAGTFGEGDGGNLTVNAAKGVQLIGASADGRFQSGLYASTEQGASGQAGNVTINTGTLLARDGAAVTASTKGSGNGGNLTVNASKAVQLIGTSADGRYASALSAQANSGASGKAGNLTINTDTLLARAGAQVTASTFGEGNGGNLTVNASKAVQLIGTSADGQIVSGLYASTEQGASGQAGDLTINTDTLLVRDGAAVTAGTKSPGNGGNLTVNAFKAVQVTGTSADGRYGSALSAQANPGASGQAGDLAINTDTLLVQAGARVSVRSFQGQAGNMTIRANSLRLNRGTLSAVTAKSDTQGGANITLIGLNLLRMDNESLISANALDQANGGNITIGSTLIVATPPTGRNGSDITANAGKGNGGAINITTQGLFGIQFRPRLTPKNDITVSSEFGVNGTFQLITPGVDPTSGLANLPTQVVDASNQILQTCAPGNAASQQSSFIVTGTGGLPPNPYESLSPDAVWVDWGTHPPTRAYQSSPTVSPKATRTTPAPLVEAQGWELNDRGEVELTAATPTTTPHSSWHRPLTCLHS